MDSVAVARFTAGAGIDPATLKIFAQALVSAAALLWSAWVVTGLFRQWRGGNIELLSLVAGTVRATILILLVIYFIQ